VNEGSSRRQPTGKEGLVPGEDTDRCDALHAFTGSANQPLHLSRLLTQIVFNALQNGLSTPLRNDGGYLASVGIPHWMGRKGVLTIS
jgi:hypothetical protein